MACIAWTFPQPLIYRRSYSHFVFCFVLEKQLNNIYIMLKRQTAVTYTCTVGLCLTVCQLNPKQSVCLPISPSARFTVCLPVCPFSHLSVLVCLFYLRPVVSFSRLHVVSSLSPCFIPRFVSYCHASHAIFSFTSAKIFQGAKCSVCSRPLDLPAVHFLCQHSFHQM